MNRDQKNYFIGYGEGFKTAFKLVKSEIESSKNEASSFFDEMSKTELEGKITETLDNYLKEVLNRLKYGTYGE